MTDYRLSRDEALAEIVAAKNEERRAYLRGADLRGADLRGAVVTGLFMDGLPSGVLIFLPVPGGWRLSIGCWTGDLDSLRAMLDGPDEDWPEARGEERKCRETVLRPVLAMCEAYAAAHPNAVEEATKTAARRAMEEA